MILECGAFTLEQGGKAHRETSPPPPAAAKCLAPWLCCAYDMPATCVQRMGGEKGAPPPPTTTTPPRANAGREGAKSAPPPPPPEDDAAGWGGRGRRVRDEPHDRARRGRAPCKPRRGDHRGCGHRIEGATEGAARLTPPPPCRGTKTTPRANDARATAGKRQAPPPPPTSLRPPKGGGCGKGRAGSGPPTPAGGAPGESTQRGQGKGRGHAACLTPQQEDKCRAACQCRACDVLTPEEGQRGRTPPPLAPTSRTHQGQWRGQRGDGEGTRGMTEASGGPPPACATGRTARTPPPPPPPPPTPTPTRRKGEGGEKKKKNTKRATEDTNMPEQGQAAGADGTGREPGGTARGQGPWG